MATLSRSSQTQSSVRLSFDSGTLALRAPASLNQSLSEPWTWDSRISGWRCHAVEYARQRAKLAQLFGDRLLDEVPPPPRVAWPQASLPALRADQREALLAWQNAKG